MTIDHFPDLTFFTGSHPSKLVVFRPEASQQRFDQVSKRSDDYRLKRGMFVEDESDPRGFVPYFKP